MTHIYIYIYSGFLTHGNALIGRSACVSILKRSKGQGNGWKKKKKSC